MSRPEFVTTYTATVERPDQILVAVTIEVPTNGWAGQKVCGEIAYMAANHAISSLAKEQEEPPF